MYYPVMLDLVNKKITIVGGGRIAFRKAAHLIEFNGDVTVISNHFSEAFTQLKDKLHLIEDSFQEIYLKGSDLVIAATDNQALNTHIGTYCKIFGILCNVVSNQELSSFIMPSYIKRGDLVISVSTGGSSPALAAQIKQKLEKEYDSSYETYVALLGAIRNKILGKNLPEDEKTRLLKSLIEMNNEALRDYLQKLS